MNKMKLEGRFHVEHWRAGKLIATHKFKNGITTVGYNNLLNCVFGAAAQTAAWFCGLIDNASFSALAVGDTMASHPGWIENVGYSNATRIQWSPVTSTIQILTNTVVMSFLITSTNTIKGLFITSVSTKSGATGILWSTGLFTSSVLVNNGDTLKVIYTLQGS